MVNNRAKIEVNYKGNIQDELIRIIQRMGDVQAWEWHALLPIFLTLLEWWIREKEGTVSADEHLNQERKQRS